MTKLEKIIHQDLPLIFDRVPLDPTFIDGVYDAFGIRDSTYNRYKTAMQHLILEAVRATASDRFVSYSRAKNYYTGQARYYGPSFTFSKVPRAVVLGMQKGMFEGELAAPLDNLFTGLQSTFRATDRLVALVQGVETRAVIHEVIRVKDGDRLVDYADTADTVRWRAEIEAINAYLADVRIGLPSEVERAGPFVLTNEGFVLGQTVRLHRIFNRNSFDCYGRVHCWPQCLPKRIRHAFTLNGEAVCEPDITASHATILYAERGLQLNFDPYGGSIQDRKSRKLAFLIAVNCANRAEAAASLSRKLLVSRQDAWELLNHVISYNKAIEDAFCSDAGIRLMRTESDIMLSTVSHLIQKKSIPCLPVHDSIIAPSRHAQTVIDALEKSFNSFLPGFYCAAKWDPNPTSLGF